MSVLDYSYITKLTIRAKMGDSDAFAELYAATHQRQYSFALQYLKNETAAKQALFETYSLALQDISKLGDPSLFVAWLNQINFRVSYNMYRKAAGNLSGSSDYKAQIVTIDSKEYKISQILNLPFTESQVIILKYFFGVSNFRTAMLMDIKPRMVKQYLRTGKTHLDNIFEGQGGVRR